MARSLTERETFDSVQAKLLLLENKLMRRLIILMTSMFIAAHISPGAARAITINESYSYNPLYNYPDIGLARAGLLLSLSTSDNWRTASFGCGTACKIDPHLGVIGVQK